MGKYLVAVFSTLLVLTDANAVRIAPQRTPDLAEKLAARNAQMAAPLNQTDTASELPSESSTSISPTQNPVSQNRATSMATAVNVPTGSAAVNTPVPNTSGSIGTVTDDVRPADKENTEDLSSLQQQIDQRKNYRDFLRNEIAKIDADMIECESSKGKWKAATVVGSIGIAATGIAAIAQAVNHKKQANNTDKKE